MAKPSKRRWAVEKRATRALSQKAKAQRVADRLLGIVRYCKPGTHRWARSHNLSIWICKDCHSKL